MTEKWDRWAKGDTIVNTKTMKAHVIKEIEDGGFTLKNIEDYKEWFLRDKFQHLYFNLRTAK
jgi:hypothetical protein